MATAYSKIQRNFWETDEAREMTPEEKYFWMYLQTNANVNTLGCYAFRMRKAMDETGYNRETLEKLLQRMEQVLRFFMTRGQKRFFCCTGQKETGTKRRQPYARLRQI